MKKIYQAPETLMVRLRARHQILSNSIAVGNAYSTGNAVLSRRSGSFWDDEDDE